jgi:RNA methyltransferase, TrmH family
MITKTEFKNIKILNQKKYRDIENKFIIEGPHLVEEALKSNYAIELILITNEYGEKNQNQITEFSKRKLRFEKIHNKDFQSISDTQNSQGILAIIRKYEFEIENYLKSLDESKRQIILALEDISDPGNLGTIIRTADWFGVDAILISSNSVDLYNPKVVRATMGSIFHLPIFPEIELSKAIGQFKDEKFQIYVTVLHGESYTSHKFNKRSVLFFGNEAHGISNELIQSADKLISIPSNGKAESLNVSIAAGIILSEIIRQK